MMDKRFRNLIFLVITFSIYNSIYCGVRVMPQFLFLNYPEKSVKLSITNPSDVANEVSISVKYGYHISDDSGHVRIDFPEKLLADDRSAVEWVKPYPNRFILPPNETQFVRILVSPPVSLQEGEYWARIVITSKKEVVVNKKAATAPTPGLELVPQLLVPFHFRYGNAQTGVDIFKPISYDITKNVLTTTFHLQKQGNASYWGTLNCRLLNGGRQVLTAQKNLVIYKNLSVNVPFDISSLQAGDYTLEATATTKRKDVDKKYIIVSTDQKWTLPIIIK
jgi:hypothetical protein